MNTPSPQYITDITLGVPSFPELMQTAEAAGFDGVTICFAYEKARAAGVPDDEIARAVAASPLSVHGVEAVIVWAGPDDPGAPYRGEPDGANVWRAAELLSTDWVGLLVVGGPDVQHEALCDAVAATADRAAAFGLDVLLEFTAWSAINTVSQAYRVLEDAGRANAKMTLDLWHHHTSADAGVDLKPFADRVGCVQISDVPSGTKASGEAPSTFGRIAPGDGEFPIARDLAALAAGGFRGPIAVEVLNNELLAEHGPTSWANRLAERTRAAIDEAAGHSEP